jgi:starch-binding outer membrane protein SusE/F
MKAIIKYFSFLLVVTTLFLSCKKDETRVVASAGKPGTLTASTTTPTVAQATASTNAVTFTYTAPSFGYDAEVDYTLQFDKKTGTFSSPAEVSLSRTGSKTFTQGELNAMAISAGLNANASDTLQVRVKYAVHNTTAISAVYSNIVKLVLTPYFDVIVYEFPKALRLAGNYQGWNPATAPKIVDKAATGSTGSNYEGYINFTDPSPEFKMVKGDNWGAGDFGMVNSTTLSNGGSNLTLGGGAGVYKINANTAAMTWSATKITTWGIIGDATAGGWGASTPMTFDGGYKWTITTNLVAGFVKFRANDDWGINFGDNSPRDNKPDYGGDNIPVAVAGNYTITLDLLAGNYNYSIKKN